MRAEDCLIAQTVISAKLCNSSVSKTGVLVQTETQEKFALDGTPSTARTLQVCRVTLGCSRVYSGTGDFHPNLKDGDRSELCDVPGIAPAMPFHSLVARKATIKRRFDEYIIFKRSIPPVFDEDCCAMLPAVEMSRDACTSSHTLHLRLRQFLYQMAT